MLVMGIDTSGKTASCALCSEEAVLAQSSFVTRLTHSQVIMPMCKRLLEDAGKTLSDVDKFAVADGPGSYTGLRIGISAVKAMSFALGKQCAGVSSLESLAYNFAGTDSRVCAVMHARQELVYSAFFDTLSSGTVRRLSEDRIISLSDLARELKDLCKEKRVICAGDFSGETAAWCQSDNIIAAVPSLNAPLASSLCYAAMAQGFADPSLLSARYLQITKAEKDLIEGKL